MQNAAELMEKKNTDNQIDLPPLEEEGELEEEVSLDEMTASSIEEMIQRVIREQMRDHVETTRVASQPTNVTVPDVSPDWYITAFRNDESPNIAIQRVDFAAYKRELQTNKNVRPGDFAIVGDFMRFRNGKLYADNDNDVEHLNWLSEHRYSSIGDPTFSDVIGGIPAIHEDDGAELFRCRSTNCDYVGASRKQLDAHRRAIHGEGLPLEG